MVWLPLSLDLKPSENFWSIIKQNVRANRHLIMSKYVLRTTIKAATMAIHYVTI